MAPADSEEPPPPFEDRRRHLLRLTLYSAGMLGLGTGAALAQEGAKGPSEVVFLAQVIVLMLVGRLLGEAMQRIGQPSVMGQLLAGILLGRGVDARWIVAAGLLVGVVSNVATTSPALTCVPRFTCRFCKRPANGAATLTNSPSA